MNFLCLLCRSTIIDHKYIERIKNDAVWSTKTSNVDIDAEEFLSLHKDSQPCFNVRCSTCKVWLGHHYRNYEGKGPHFKLFIQDKHLRTENKTVLLVVSSDPSVPLSESLKRHQLEVGAATLAPKVDTETSLAKQLGLPNNDPTISALTKALKNPEVRSFSAMKSTETKLEETKQELANLRIKKEELEESKLCCICMDHPKDIANEW